MSNSREFEIKDGVLVKYNGHGGKIIIPDSVFEIGKDAFQSNFFDGITLKEITMPIGMTYFGSFPRDIDRIAYEIFYGLEALPNRRWRVKNNKNVQNGPQRSFAIVKILWFDFQRPVSVVNIGPNGRNQSCDIKYRLATIIPLTEKAIPVYDQLVAGGKYRRLSMNKKDRIYSSVLRLGDKEFPVAEEFRSVFVELLEGNVNEVIKYAEEDSSPQYIQTLIDVGVIDSSNKSKVEKRLLKSTNPEIREVAKQVSSIDSTQKNVVNTISYRPLFDRLGKIDAIKLFEKYGIDSFPEVFFADGSGPAPAILLKYILAEYMHNYNGYFYDRIFKTKIIVEADKVAELIDKQSLQSALLSVYSNIPNIYHQMAVLPALFRYADGDTIRRIYPARATHHYWNDWHNREDPASEALLLSDTIDAVQYADKYGLLKRYSNIHSIDEDYLKNQILSLPEIEDIIQSVYDFEVHGFVDPNRNLLLQPISDETLKKYLEDSKEYLNDFTDIEIPDVLLADKTGPAPKVYFEYILSEYMGDLVYPQIVQRIEEVARLLDRDSLKEAVDVIYKDYVKHRMENNESYINIWAAIFRFASGSTVKSLYSSISHTNPDVEDMLLSDTREAMIIADRKGLLWKYAFIRETTEEKIRDHL